MSVLTAQRASGGPGYSPSGEGRLDFVRVPAVRPEDEQPVEQRLDVGHHVFALGVDLQEPPLFLQKNVRIRTKRSDVSMTYTYDEHFY